MTPLRKAPTERDFRPDVIDITAFKNLEMKDYSQLNESALQYLDKDYFYSTNENNIVFYKMKIPEASIPAVTESILIDKNYHVKL